jgi:hypothetical protein
MSFNKSYFWFVRGAKHAAMALTSIASVRKVEKGGVRCFVITDDGPGRDWDLGKAAQVLYIDPGMPIMLANLEAQVQAMFHVAHGEQAVFLDTDIILLQQLPNLADMTITWRDHVGVKEDEKIEGVAAQMPYNYGVMVARKNDVTMEAFIWMRERIRKMHGQYQQWYGNQLALVELAGHKPEQPIQVDTKRIPWTLTSKGRQLRIAKIPCDTYNYTPESITEDVSEKAALHFKGHSRELMGDFAARFELPWVTEEQVKSKEAA